MKKAQSTTVQVVANGIKPAHYRLLAYYKHFEKILKSKRRHANALRKQQKTYDILKNKYLNNIPADTDLSSLKNELKVMPGINLENNIIQYWHQGCTPEKAKLNHGEWKAIHHISNASVDKYYHSQRIILDAETLQDYINFPSDIKEKLLKLNKMPMLSDLIRTALLFCYGGTWLDFTILLLNKIPDYCQDKELFFFLRQGDLNIESIKSSDIKKQFSIHDPYYFGFDDSFKVNQLNSFIHAKEGNVILGVMLKVLFLFIRENDPRDYEYFIYMILFELLIEREEFKYIKSLLTSNIPSDVCCHILQVFDYIKFDDSIYMELISKYPIQKLNAGCRLIKGSLLLEVLKRQNLI